MIQEDFEFLRTFLRAESGLVLAVDKVYLVESRLMPVARKRALNGLDELVSAVRGGKDKDLCVEVVEAMTTNESYFFRDIKPFESLRDVVLPRIVGARKAAGAKSIRIWCGACSSGQEPYTIAMILKESPSLLQGLSVEIVATDLSAEILIKAKAGVYTQFEAQRGLPVTYLIKYFEKVGEQWRIRDEVRNSVSYRQANLLHDLSFLGRFDVVFLRNVLIYFELETKTDVLARISRMVPADGMLYLGGAESVIGISDRFKSLAGVRGVYVLDETKLLAPLPPPAVAAPASQPLANTA